MKSLRYLLLSLALGACAHGKMGAIEQPLAAGVITKNTPIAVETVSANDAAFSGDKSGDVTRVNQEKREIESRFAQMIVSQLVKRGYKASVSEGTAKSGVVLSGKVTKIEHGSAAARIMVGMGAGSANMFTNFKLEDRTAGKMLSKFQVIATSGGRGGFMAAGSFMEAHLEDGSTKTAQYLTGEK